METKNQDETLRERARLRVTHAGTPGALSDADDSQHEQNAEAVADIIEVKPTAASIRDLIASVPAVRNLVVATAVRCLGSQRSMSGKDREVVRAQDGATQMKAVVWLSAYADGLPIQTTMNVNVDANKEMPLEDMLQRSPALVRAVEAQLARAKRVQKGGSEKQVGPASGNPAG